MLSEISDFFAEDVSRFTQRLSSVDGLIDSQAEPRVDDRLDALGDAIGRSCQACRRIEAVIGDDRPLLEEIRQQFRERIAQWFDRSWFMQRAKTKPRGYPGDYELLTAIYDRKPKARGLGGYLDLYFLNTTLARAVRARLMAAKMFLIQEVGRRRGDVSILNVACGPCRELADGFLYRADRRVHLMCVDADRQALKFVEAHVMSVGVDLPDMDCTCYNALRMSVARNNIRKFGRCDIVYSVGLCDYIPDKYLIPMLQGLRDSLNQDGVLYVALKDANRYDKTEYQWHVDWHFFQRTEDDCREIFRQAGFDGDSLEMTRCQTGVIMNFIGRVRRPSLIRVDAAGKRKGKLARSRRLPRTSKHKEAVREEIQSRGRDDACCG